MATMQRAYWVLLNRVHHTGHKEVNSRTGKNTLILPGGQSFTLDLRDGRLPVPGNRRYWPHVAAAETAWQFMGTRDPGFIMRHAPKIWRNFIGEDGLLQTAYGYRWRQHFGRDQIDGMIQELRANPTNRQLYVSAWDPVCDGLGGEQPPNVPCPVGFAVNIVDGRANLSVFIRSSDMFVGLPYDVMGYALTLDAIAASVGARPGILHVTLAHAHVYEPHFEELKACIVSTYHGSGLEDHTEWTTNVEPLLPGWSIDYILERPDDYVSWVLRLAGEVNHNPWDPKPVLVV